MIQCLKNYGQRFITCTGGSDQNHPKVKEMKAGKVAFWGGFTSSWGKKRRESQRRSGKIYPTECKVPEDSKESKKTFLKKQCKEIEGEKIRWVN